jgi:ATP-dependent RNA helicase HrpB
VNALPVDSAIDAVRAALRQRRAVVVTAPPGAGKTTRIPPALLDAGRVILLQPRRVAVRAIANRIAHERGWTVGREIGWQIRFERRFTPATQLLVVTEGILTARLQSDPFLSEFNTIVIDEFHERSLHADLALALSMQSWRARPDLRIAIMSATLDAESVSRFLDECPIVSIASRQYPLSHQHAPGETVARAAMRMAAEAGGDVLCFLPGAAEIRRTVAELESLRGESSIEVLPLCGSLDSAEQDRALEESPAGTTRIVVATNIAETSVTVPGVRAVVDSGLQRVVRHDPARGIDSLTTERITQDSADQRAGRAGRTSSGRVVRLWDARDRLTPHREAEIHRVDLGGAALDILAWGAHPVTLEWFERPSPEAIAASLALLQRLGAVVDSRLTDVGRQMHRLSLSPRLARMLVEAEGSWAMVQACALLSERLYLAPMTQSTTADLLSAIDRWESMPAHVKQMASDIERLTTAVFGQRRRTVLDEAEFRRGLLAGYPDRIGQRREQNSPRFKLSTGTGAVLGRESGVLDADLIVALDIRDSRSTTPVNAHEHRVAREPVIRIAARIEPDWLSATHSTVRCWFDEADGVVRAARVDCYDALTLRETAIDPDMDRAAELLAEAWSRRGASERDAMLLNRLRFAGHEPDLAGLVKRAALGQRALADVELASAVDRTALRALDRDAPESLVVPSGRRVPLEYAADGTVSAAVKLQELFGLGETPRVGRRQEPVLLALLAPNGRPVQMTRDLRSFWTRTYPEVRRELRGRYPRHPWPEDPWQAEPTARPKKRQL